MYNTLLNLNSFSVLVNEHMIVQPTTIYFLPGKTYVLMGQNGSGKSSLFFGILGHPYYKTTGSCILGDTELTTLSTDKRARLGIFLAPQYSVTLSGVRVFDFMKEAVRAYSGVSVEIDVVYDELCKHMTFLGLDHSFAQRGVNEGFSGGERKRFELLQMLMLKPSIIMLDEIDSGLDVSGRHLIKQTIDMLRQYNPALTVFAVTHYKETVHLYEPDYTLCMNQGKLTLE